MCKNCKPGRGRGLQPARGSPPTLLLVLKPRRGGLKAGFPAPKSSWRHSQAWRGNFGSVLGPAELLIRTGTEFPPAPSPKKSLSQEESRSMLQPRASMSLLMWEIIRSHSSSSEGTDCSSELPAAPLPLVVELEVVLSVRRYLPKLSVMMPRPSFTPMVSRKFSKCWLSFSGIKGRKPTPTEEKPRRK